MSRSVSTKPSIMRRLVTAATVFRRGLSFDAWASMVSGGSTKDRPTQPYSQVVPVRVCVQFIAQSISSIPFRISTTDDEVIEDGPLARLVARPNLKQTASAFWYMTSAHWLLFGRYHWLIEGEDVNELSVTPLNPLQMTEKTEDGVLVGWTFRPGSQGSDIELTLDQVYTMTDPDFYRPDKPWQGMSAREAASLAIAQHYKADLANEASLDNDVQPSGAIATDQNLTAPQRDVLKRDLESEHAGSKNRRKIMLLEGGLHWEQMSASFADMEFSTLRSHSREDICASYGLKAIIWWSQGGSGMNDSQDKSAIITAYLSTIRPLSVKFAEAFTCEVIGRLKGDDSLAMRRGMRKDWRKRKMGSAMRGVKSYTAARSLALVDESPAIAWFDDTSEHIRQALFLAQAEAAEKWHRMGVTLNDILGATDAPFEERPHGDIPRIPVGMIDARSSSPEYPGVSETSEDTPADLDHEDMPLDDASPTNAKNILRAVQPDIACRLSEAHLVSLLKSWENMVLGATRSFEGPYRTHLMSLRKPVIDRVKSSNLAPAGVKSSKTSPTRYHWLEWTKTDGHWHSAPRESVFMLTDAQRDVIADVVFDVQATTNARWRVVSKFIVSALGLGGDQSLAEAAAAEGAQATTVDPFNIADPEAQVALRQRRISIASLTQDQAHRLRATLADGLSKNETRDQIIDRVKAQFNLETSRARLVAHQETSSAIEEGRHLGRVQSGIPHKSWLWSRKETGRSVHAATEKATLSDPIPVAQDFTLAGTSITAPHPRATGIAEQDINCGCTTLSRFPNDQVREARLFEFLTTRGFLTARLLRRSGDHA